MTLPRVRRALWPAASAVALALALALPAAPGPAGSEGEELPPAPPHRTQRNRFYLSVGLGLLSLDRGVGVDVPVELSAAFDRLRLVASGAVADLGLLEGGDRDPRYYRPSPLYSYCMDTLTGGYVPDYYCSGGTDAILSASADLGYVVFDEIRISDQPGRLYAGAGYRFAKPRTPYATVGMLFDRSSSRVGRVRLAIGERYVSLGFSWGIHLFGF
ncbi:MAG: hypothetical protein AB1505_03220 [Candidatus Latescibacterota bacterium]